MADRRARTITVPTSRPDFDRVVHRLLGRMVMSRTEVHGEPIHRELELLDSPPARRSIAYAWCLLQSRPGTHVTITFVLFRDDRGRVERVLVEVPRNLRPPRPAPEPVPPSYVPIRSSWEILNRERGRILQRIETAEERLYQAQQNAAGHGSRLYELTPTEPSLAEQTAEAGEIVGILRRGFDETQQKYNQRFDHMLAEEFEQQARGHEFHLAGLQQNLVTINNEMEQERLNWERYRTRQRTPGPALDCAQYL